MNLLMNSSANQLTQLFMKKIRVFFLLLALALLADQSFAQCPTFSRRNNGAGGTCSSFDVGNIPAGKVHAGRFTFTPQSPSTNYQLTKVTINGVLIQEGSVIYSGTKWFGSYNGPTKDLCFYGNDQNDNAAPAGNWKLYFYDPSTGQTYICSFIFNADGSQSNFNPGVIGSDQSICAGSTPATLTSSSAASGNAGTLTYQWQQSTTSAADGFTNISGATSATYSPGALTQTTYFQRIANDGTTISASSNVITVTVTAPPTTTPVTQTVLRANCSPFTTTTTSTTQVYNLTMGHGDTITGTSQSLLVITSGATGANGCITMVEQTILVSTYSAAISGKASCGQAINNPAGQGVVNHQLSSATSTNPISLRTLTGTTPCNAGQIGVFGTTGLQTLYTQASPGFVEGAYVYTRVSLSPLYLAPENMIFRYPNSTSSTVYIIVNGQMQIVGTSGSPC